MNESKWPPLSRRVAWTATAVLVLTALAIVVDARRVRTGELLIQSGRGEIRIVLKQGDKTVAGPTGTRSFVLKPGAYDVEVNGEARGQVRIDAGRRAVMALP